VANSLNLFRNGGVGFIDWLGPFEMLFNSISVKVAAAIPAQENLNDVLLRVLPIQVYPAKAPSTERRLLTNRASERVGVHVPLFAMSVHDANRTPPCKLGRIKESLKFPHDDNDQKRTNAKQNVSN
jgi:hypothetical protein